MEHCGADPCVFRPRKDREMIMILCVYDVVNDILALVKGESGVYGALFASLLHESQTTQGDLSQ